MRIRYESFKIGLMRWPLVGVQSESDYSSSGYALRGAKYARYLEFRLRQFHLYLLFVHIEFEVSYRAKEMRKGYSR